MTSEDFLAVFDALIDIEDKKVPIGSRGMNGSVDIYLCRDTNEFIKKRNSCRAAVLVLIEKLHPPQRIIDFVAKRYLAIFTKNRNSFTGNSDALSVAGSVAEFGTSSEISESIISEMARAGWYGRIEEFAKKVLRRDLMAEEVLLLTESYTKDMVSRSEHEEKNLVRMAKKYGSRVDCKKVITLLKNFRKYWDNCID